MARGGGLESESIQPRSGAGWCGPPRAHLPITVDDEAASLVRATVKLFQARKLADDEALVASGDRSQRLWTAPVDGACGRRRWTRWRMGATR